MPKGRFRRTGTTLLVAVAAGCASRPEYVTPRDHAEAWLAERPRTLQIHAAPARSPVFLERDDRTKEKLEHAAAGAFDATGAVAAACLVPPYATLFCLFTAPILFPAAAATGAVLKSREVKPHYVPRDMEARPGLQALYDHAISRSDPLPLLTRTLADAANEHRRHVLLEGSAAADSTGRVVLELGIDFAGSQAEDPDLAPVLHLAARIQGPNVDAPWAALVHTGGSKKLSEWRDDPPLLRQEVERGIDRLARELAQKLHAEPSAGALRRVANWKRLEAEMAQKEALFRAEEERRARASTRPPIGALPSPPVVEPHAPGPARTWSYLYEDRLYGRAKVRFSVEAAPGGGDTVTDRLRDEGDGLTRGVFDRRSIGFTRRFIGSGRSVHELAPYTDAVGLHASLASPSGDVAGVAAHRWKIRVLEMKHEQVTVPAGTFDSVKVELEDLRTTS
jgi:hypothetical protein